ncbi:hypothetical protein [Falsarthrobacter nasiphocae]|uniref:Uncharacterized protein n=1 Tax=Falsarthrobacter nasiphocae TaxID=189863 RepID=A0AAE3YF88_9MICC|nr:hypothetical protein [Falsarthrobacter nasiphocae]MDR6892319.1 hypothetical protein [Falsarthrobacter nasiphocae]
MNPLNSTTSRRRVVGAAAWSAPIIALSSAAPAMAASQPPLGEPGDLAIAIVDPAADGSLNTPIYWGNTTQVAQMGDMPPGLVVTNVGSTPIASATGTLELQMQNQDATSNLAYRTQARTTDSFFTLVDTTPGVPPTGAARTYRWTLTRPLQPGESVTIPFQYYTPKTFTNPDFSVLVLATINDAVEFDSNDLDARVGFVPGYSTTIFGP